MHGMTPLIAIHATLAGAALLLGPINLFRRPKGDTFHRVLGYVWIGSMTFVSVSSFWIRTLNPGHLSWIHILSCVMLVSLTGGVIAARRHNIPSHRGFMTGAYLGLWGAFLPAVLSPGRMIREIAVGAPWSIALGAAIVIVLSALFYAGARTLAYLADRRRTRGSSRTPHRRSDSPRRVPAERGERRAG